MINPKLKYTILYVSPLPAVRAADAASELIARLLYADDPDEVPTTEQLDQVWTRFNVIHDSHVGKHSEGTHVVTVGASPRHITRLEHALAALRNDKG